MNWSIDHLGGVHEVAELRLPQDEVVGRLDRVAVLEAERARLGERAVVDLQRGLRPVEVLDRRVAPARLGVLEHQVALAERAARGVLAGQPQRHALHAAATRTRAPPPGPSRPGRRRRSRARFARWGASLRWTCEVRGSEKSWRFSSSSPSSATARLGLLALRCGRAAAPRSSVRRPRVLDLLVGRLEPLRGPPQHPVGLVRRR